MLEDLMVIVPEMVLLTMACITLVVDLFLCKKTRWVTYVLAQLSVLTTLMAGIYIHSPKITAFGEQFIADPFAQGMKIFILIIMFLVFMYSRRYAREKEIAYGEFHALALFSTLGMMVLVSAKSFLMIYLGLELLTLPLYALVALHRNSPLAVEAGMKYFVTGALASGLLLYGISLLYGITGSIQLSEVATYMQTVQGSSMHVALVALVFIIVGIAFKLGAVPFHMWVPDVYQGAPTNITLLIGTAPKVAAFGMAYRLLHDGLPGLSFEWSHILMVLAILSMAIGNIVAIAQTNLKRLLAYSTIAHVGFLFLGLLVAPIVGYTAALYYIVVYALVVAVAFGVLLYISNQEFDAQTFDDIKGLGARHPWIAFLMLLVAFSLAGVPPTVGFYAKFMILSALVNGGMVWLAALAVVFSIIGAFYYLKIVRAMYFEAPNDIYPVADQKDFATVLSINGLGILLLGIFPAPLFMMCQKMFL
jgi:NADH-quinone oxidoreductase subunit N